MTSEMREGVGLGGFVDIVWSGRRYKQKWRLPARRSRRYLHVGCICLRIRPEKRSKNHPRDWQSHFSQLSGEGCSVSPGGFAKVTPPTCRSRRDLRGGSLHFFFKYRLPDRHISKNLARPTASRISDVIPDSRVADCGDSGIER